MAFLLGFSFNIVNNIHTERKSLVLEEANAIGTLFLRTEIFELEQANKIKDILRHYVTLRIDMTNNLTNETFLEGVAESERMHEEIWGLVIEIVKLSNSTLGSAQLITAANEFIDIHSKRVNAGYQRLPKVSVLLLIFIAILTLALMGFQSGLNGIRIIVPRIALILSLATVMIVIVDLDRPGGNLIEVSQKTMHDLKSQINPD